MFFALTLISNTHNIYRFNMLWACSLLSTGMQNVYPDCPWLPVLFVAFWKYMGKREWEREKKWGEGEMVCIHCRMEAKPLYNKNNFELIILHTQGCKVCNKAFFQRICSKCIFYCGLQIVVWCKSKNVLQYYIPLKRCFLCHLLSIAHLQIPTTFNHHFITSKVYFWLFH